MKKIIFSNFRFLIAIAIVFITFSLASAQDCPPKPDPKVEGTCQDIEMTSTVVSPLAKEFPDCKLSVTYKIQQCTRFDPATNKAITTIRIFDYDIDVNSSSAGCIELLEKLGDPSAGGQEFLRRFNVSIGRQLQDDVANIFIIQSGPSTFDCNNQTAQNIFETNYYQAGCISFVKGTIMIGGKPKLLVRQVPCASSACCGIGRTYCYDTVEKKLKFTEKEIPLISPTCEGELPPIPAIFKILKAKDIKQGPCIALCGALTPMEKSEIQIFKSSIAGQVFQMKVYPNPSSDYINVYFDKEIKGTVELYNLEGRILQTNETELGSTYFEVSLLPKGTYVVKFTTTDGEIMAEKIAIH